MLSALPCQEIVRGLAERLFKAVGPDLRRIRPLEEVLAPRELDIGELPRLGVPRYRVVVFHVDGVGLVPPQPQLRLLLLQRGQHGIVEAAVIAPAEAEIPGPRRGSRSQARREGMYGNEKRGCACSEPCVQGRLDPLVIG